jgi:hypothetical protein
MNDVMGVALHYDATPGYGILSNSMLEDKLARWLVVR